jgi:hypothetical protein
MRQELRRELAMQDAAHALSRNFGKVFNSQILWLENLDSLLGTSIGVPMKLPEQLRGIHGDDESTWA